jgi:hypothetical protein
MLDPDRRKKMISLRLSEAEFELLKTRYHSYGARNISELTRLALHRIMTGSPDTHDDAAKKLTELDDRLHQLEASVSLLLEREKVMS